MEQKTTKLYPSAPLEKDDLKQRLEKKLDVANSFNNSINNIKEMITYFEDKNHESKKKYEKYKTLHTIIESLDAFVINGATSTSVTLSITGVGLNILPTSAGIACAQSLGNKILHRMTINKCNK